jgi:hypothetical protein
MTGSADAKITGRRGRVRLTAIVAAYALVLQGLVSAIAFAQGTARAAAAAAQPGYELCLHDAGDEPLLPSDTDRRDCAHCIFCAIAGSPVVVPPSAIGCVERGIAGVTVSWPGGDRRVSLRNWSPGTGPRGPPGVA